MKIWLNPTRDRWLNIEDHEPWQFWLYAIREFWLMSAEEAQASGANIEAFDKMSEECGYLPGHSTPIGRRVWAVMVTQQKSLNQTRRERGLSSGQELDQYEEPADWIHDGTIKHVFHAFAYFCGVLVARRIRELEKLNTLGQQSSAAAAMVAAQGSLVNGSAPIAPESSRHLSYQEAPVFRYEYPDEFPASLQLHIEKARLEANKQLEDKDVRSYEEHMAARIEWFWHLLSEVATTIGAVPATAQWSVKRGRQMLSDVGLKAAEAARSPSSRVQKLFESERWHTLDDRLLASLKPLESPSVDPLSRALSPAPESAQEESLQLLRSSTRRGRRPNTARRDSIRSAIEKHGDDWREHLPEILNKLDTNNVFLGDFHGIKIELGDGETTSVSKWADLDLALGQERARIIDFLRKYVDRRTKFARI